VNSTPTTQPLNPSTTQPINNSTHQQFNPSTISTHQPMANNIDPANEVSIETQTAMLGKFLLSGRKWHCYLPDRKQMAIGYPNSRIADLRDKFALRQYIQQETMIRKNNNGHTARCQVYFIPLDKLADAKQSLKQKSIKLYEKISALSQI